MSRTNYGHIKQIVADAMEHGPQERAAFVETACNGDSELLSRVHLLIKAATDADANRFMDSIAQDNKPQELHAPIHEQPGTRIGSYKLLQQIGEGGFGSVFMAEQETPIHRKVAFKIIKLGMDTRAVIARFEAERQALAMMDHPNIARVYDAGQTESGRPYFAMELVKGEAITTYCDENHLSVSDRLELFLQVCNAVQHAHQRGIIHRDIKPGNVLASTQDGRPFAKVIDFGIAKALADRLTEKTLFTEYHRLIGTPQYMSPEQAAGSLDIDTRTDIYSLGTLLYQLLTGSTPLDPKELHSAAFDEMRAIIREYEPPKPSTRLSQSNATLGMIAASRATEPKRLGVMVRGELDWIVMKALEKDRSRRYESASALAADIRSHLHGQTVVAAPPTAMYRLRKSAARHKTALATASIILLVMVAATGTYIHGIRAEQNKTAAALIEAEAQRGEAQRQEKIATGVNQLLTVMLTSANPNFQPGKGFTVLQAISGLAAQLDNGALKDQPLVEASLRSTIGETELSLGDFQGAKSDLQKALVLRQQSLPAEHLDIVTSLNDLAECVYKLGAYAEAESLFRQALTSARRSLPAEHAQIARSLHALAAILLFSGKYVEAEAMDREALQIRRDTLPPDDPDIAKVLNGLSDAVNMQGKLAESEALDREALAIRRKSLPPGHPYIANSETFLARVLWKEGKYVEAEALNREALAIRRKAWPAGHPDIAKTLVTLAATLTKEGKFTEAEAMGREAMDIRRKALPPGHPDIAEAADTLAGALTREGKYPEAESLSREALDIRHKVSPTGDSEVADSAQMLGNVLYTEQRYADAEAYYREALEIRRSILPAVTADFGDCVEQLAADMRIQGKLNDAESLWRDCLKALVQILPADDTNIASMDEGLAGVLIDEHRPGEAEPLLRQAMAIRSRKSGQNAPETRRTAQLLSEISATGSSTQPD